MTPTSARFSPADTALLELAHLLQKGGYRFITPTPATHERVNSRPQNARARSVEDVMGWSRPFHPEILPPAVWQAMQSAGIAEPIVESSGDLWRSTLRLSSLGGTLFFHSAYPTTDADAVFFGPDTYRFAAAIEQFFLSEAPKIERAIDICCGAGPGALTVARFRPDAAIFATDINERALRLTRVNAAFSGAQVEAKRSDLLRDVEGDFDLMVANPPYLVDASERAYRHGGGPLGAELSLSIVESSVSRLNVGGTLLLYTGAAIVDNHDPFLQAVTEKLDGFEAVWSYREVDPDVFGEELQHGPYARADRIAAVVLTVKKLG